jgi:hypothetical protein
MKRLMVTGALVLSMMFTLGLASDAAAVGRAAALLLSSGQTSAVGLIDFNEAQFTQADAQDLITVLQGGIPILQQLLTSQAPGVSINVVVLTPDQMTSFGLGDADTADQFIQSNFATLGVDAYLKAVATKVQAPEGVTGQNIRLDLYLFIGTGNLQYVASLEVPEQLIDQLNALLSFM